MEHKDWVDELAAQLGNGSAEVPLTITLDNETEKFDLEITDVRLQDGVIKVTVMRL